MTYRLEVKGPLRSGGADPGPAHEFWQMSAAQLSGPKIEATSPMPGIDWFSPSPDGFGRPHVRVPFRTDDGALVLLEYRGIVEASDAFLAAVAADTATRWEDPYMRMPLMFETASVNDQWLTQNVFLARGRLIGAKSIEYDVYRVT